MKDLKNIAIEIAAISAGGPTNWALLSEDASTKELKIVNKGSNGLPELRKALTSVKANMASGAAAPSPSLVGYVNYNNVPLKLRLMDSKPSRALAKHHDVKVLLKNHVAVLDVENVDSDLKSHKLTVFRDELKKAAVVSWNLSGAKVNYPTSDECDLRNSFEISSLPSGTTFYADCPDALHRLTAAIELSAL
ncbi:hypothetical protein BC830DRAFT_855813 [Chytriomyces sp. MP71]|nr:hypothetical protein BC830DRAFT_855813 [Chytriomyces sp. MP71]